MSDRTIPQEDFIHAPLVTRVTVVTNEGLELDHYDAYQGGVDIHLQDDGRTLKIFPKGERA